MYILSCFRFLSFYFYVTNFEGSQRDSIINFYVFLFLIFLLPNIIFRRHASILDEKTEFNVEAFILVIPCRIFCRIYLCIFLSFFIHFLVHCFYLRGKTTGMINFGDSQKGSIVNFIINLFSNIIFCLMLRYSIKKRFNVSNYLFY